MSSTFFIFFSSELEVLFLLLPLGGGLPPGAPTHNNLFLPPSPPPLGRDLGVPLVFPGEAGALPRQQGGPAYDESKTIAAQVQMAVQVCGKLRGTITVPVDSDEATVVAAALADPKGQNLTEGKALVKSILVPNKLGNLIAW